MISALRVRMTATSVATGRLVATVGARYIRYNFLCYFAEWLRREIAVRYEQ